MRYILYIEEREDLATQPPLSIEFRNLKIIFSRLFFSHKSQEKIPLLTWQVFISSKQHSRLTYA